MAGWPAATAGVGGGTGLGLAIVAAVVRAHDGTIEGRSVPGSTEFVVRLSGDLKQIKSASRLPWQAGGLTGAAVALLYAPRSGQETRDLLSERMRETADRGRELKEQAVGRGRALVNDATSYVERQKQELESRKERFAA